ncbi:FAD:protein FMN transferase [Terrimonas sp. NA20]|uniref:FAD:protein FMN transferase n=1 Tax=Terrimonas ginsenosidimutans TaxID=2908004 RepID=A0ABS9KVF4_9BACT|nr:FAD:protein FMN transferase [Terrimonas ginsenosidimutans]MCG2616270.1 FAD:protein FMN transferase [Terrimonas ginsenosidimutans]
MKEYRRSSRLMGNHFEITVLAGNEQNAHEFIETGFNEIERIEKLLTTFDESSQVNKVNAKAGISSVKVDREVFDLIARSIRISGITDGAFDITYGSIDKRLWNFDRTMTALPDPETARRMVRLIDYRKVILDEQAATVYLPEKGMRIGFGGIGKGYAAEKAKTLLMQQGIPGGIINASGDLAAWGKDASGNDWTVGISNPDNATDVFSWLPLKDMAIATSGNYEKYVLINGQKYSHTINPKTGLPVTGIKSVTVLAPNAELADAMTTPVMIMGIKAGLSLINQVKGLACIIIDDHKHIYSSSNIRLQ